MTRKTPTEPAAAPPAPALDYPRHGGRYVRHPESGELTRVEGPELPKEPGPAEPVAVAEPGQGGEILES